MRNLPKAAQIYISIVSLTALGLLVYFTSEVPLNRYAIQGLIFFGILAVFTDSLKVNLPRGGYVTVTFAVTYTCLLLFGFVVASYVTMAGTVFSKFITRDKSPWYKLMFNCGQFMISIYIAQMVYLQTGGIIGRVNPMDVIPLVTSASVCFLINHLALSIVLALVQGGSPWRIWISNLKWTLPNLFTLSLLGILMAGIYKYAGYWGVSLFFVPLLLGRYIFKSYMEDREIYLNTLEALASALDAKDKYTKGHSDRVARYAVEIARVLKLPEDQVEVIEHMALLHDIGKIGISDELLNRSEKFSQKEFDIIKLHPVIGANILREVDYFGNATEYVKHHHEKYDGSGYPEGLNGEGIPLGARIITLADSFDAMTSDRSYRQKVTSEDALAEVRRCAGSHFDPKIADAFVRCWQQTDAVVRREALLEVASTADE